MRNHQSFFTSLLPATHILDQARDITAFANDSSTLNAATAALVLFPRNTSELSQILSYCSEQDLAVTPSGGRTGLAGAAQASSPADIIISLTKLNEIYEIDPISGSIQVAAGAVLQDVQEAAEKEGLYFPIDFAAKGSAQIGGIISTNAGGIHVVRYGMTRQAVLGLEVVLMDGTILNLDKKLLKDNSGYDLKQFFIGAEGTLGFITKATFRLVASPTQLSTALFAIENINHLPTILKIARKAALQLHAFELLSQKCLDHVCKQSSELRSPFDDHSPFYLIFEIEEKSTDELLEFGQSLAEIEAITDAVLATSAAERNALWAYRENISESLRTFSHLHKEDVSVPVGLLPMFLPSLIQLIETKYSNLQLFLFGHIADGNMHINIAGNQNVTVEEFQQAINMLETDLFRLVSGLGGSISAEHGIGLLKKKHLHFRRSEKEIELMKKLKQVFDPKNLLNNGKIF